MSIHCLTTQINLCLFLALSGVEPRLISPEIVLIVLMNPHMSLTSVWLRHYPNEEPQRNSHYPHNDWHKLPLIHTVVFINLTTNIIVHRNVASKCLIMKISRISRIPQRQLFGSVLEMTRKFPANRSHKTISSLSCLCSALKSTITAPSTRQNTKCCWNSAGTSSCLCLFPPIFQHLQFLLSDALRPSLLIILNQKIYWNIQRCLVNYDVVNCKYVIQWNFFVRLQYWS